MKVVIAIDSFKGSLSSMEAGHAAAEGILRADPNADIVVRPLADGGEGTVETLVQGLDGRIREIPVTGPLGEIISASYGIIDKSGMAVIEMSAAAGLPMVPADKRNPLYTTTYGVGEMIRDAIKLGMRRFLVGIGGSATNDGGAGMLQALGFGLLDANGNDIPHGARGLEALAQITDMHAIPELKDCTFRIACDVNNPLCGEKGASAVYGPQKGADPEMVKQMDAWLAAFAALAKEQDPAIDPDMPGSGAAGGLGFAFQAFLHGELRSGIQIVLEETGLENDVKDADAVVTGEGRLDFQTAMGKAPVGVAKLAKKYGATTIAFAGSVTPEATECNRNGIDAFFPILRGVVTLEEAMDSENAHRNLAATAEQAFRLALAWKH
ncbi:MAG: glycerate kinase [Clostridiales bacterium]|nr:glycerate kinase [Clostridiales bacterium]